jgi:hypothetical protein
MMQNVDNSKIKLKDVSFRGLKPFEIVGSNIEMVFEGIEMAVPYRGMVKLDYGFVFSCSIFHEKLQNIRHFVNELAMVYWEYYSQNKRAYQNNVNDEIDNFCRALAGLHVDLPYVLDVEGDENAVLGVPRLTQLFAMARGGRKTDGENSHAIHWFLFCTRVFRIPVGPIPVMGGSL